MKRILITGANSYIGTSFEKYIKQWPEDYQVDTVDMIDGSWRNMSFASYQVVFHVAGIAHRKETKKNAHLYYEINCDLAAETSKKAKEDGVSQFIYLSSMSVYGMVSGIVTPKTLPNPTSNYGKSKLQGENAITLLSDDKFKIAIIRPPMVYGQGCKGNYQTLIKFAKNLPIFPNIINRRSMIKITRLCTSVKETIDSEKSGLLFPQDPQYICTTQMVREIALKENHKIIFTKIFNPLIKVLPLKYMRKIFGDFIYENMEEE